MRIFKFIFAALVRQVFLRQVLKDMMNPADSFFAEKLHNCKTFIETAMEERRASRACGEKMVAALNKWQIPAERENLRALLLEGRPFVAINTWDWVFEKVCGYLEVCPSCFHKDVRAKLVRYIACFYETLVK